MANFDDLWSSFTRARRNYDDAKAAINAAYGRAAFDYADTDSIRYSSRPSWDKYDIYRYCTHDIKATEDACMNTFVTIERGNGKTKLAQEVYNKIMNTNMLGGLGWYDWLSNNIQRVIFNKPYTIVIFKDKTKSVVKASNEEYDPEKGFVMALLKRILSPESSKYYKLVKKYCDDASQTEENVKRIKKMNEEYEQDKGFGSILDRFLKGVVENAHSDNDK